MAASNMVTALNDKLIISNVQISLLRADLAAAQQRIAALGQSLANEKEHVGEYVTLCVKRDQRIAALEAELVEQKRKTAAILNERINSVAAWKEAGEMDNESLDFNWHQRFARGIEAAYQRGYSDAVKFVEAEAAQRAAAGRGE